MIVAGWPLALAGEALRDLWLGAWVVYLAAVVLSGALAALRFRSLRVGGLAAVGLVAVHVTYAIAVVRGVFRRSRA